MPAHDHAHDARMQRRTGTRRSTGLAANAIRASIRVGSNWGKRIKRIENHEDNMTTETAHRRADTSASKAAFIPCIVVRARLG
jgi:hypothetical protein